MKQIEKAIQFAIENGLYWRVEWYNWYYELKFHSTNYLEVSLIDAKVVLMDKKNIRGKYRYSAYNLCWLIMSKLFIEALARGLHNKWWNTDIHIWKNVYEYFDSEEEFEKLQEDICTQQSLAIANNELESFYENLLGNNKEW